jgi:outer membrane immunogenic protein
MNRIERVLRFAAATIACAGLADSAFAADLPLTRPPAPPVEVINWTGFYIGGGIAAAFNSADYSRPLSGLGDTSIGSIDSRPAFMAYGGFNYQLAPWAVIGVEGGGTWFDTATFRELGPNLDFLQESRHIASVTARAGIVLRPDTMVYGKVGPAWIETEGFQGFGDTFRQTLPAIQTGIGIESMIAPNLTLRAEASYTRATRDLSLNQGFDMYRPSFLMFDLGVAYKFDSPAGWGVPGVVAVPAAAAQQTMPYKARASGTDVAPAGPRWTGFEVGGFVSANGNQVAFEDSLLGETGPYTSFNVGGGWFAGANFQIQRVVLGIEVSGNYEAAKFQTAAGSGGLANNFFQFARIDQTLALTARAGWLITLDTLLYAKGGPAQIRLTPDQLYFNAVAPNATPATNLTGYQAGIGAETFLTPNISVRAEGLYTYTANTIILNGVVPNEFKLKPYMLSGTFGAALHF